MILGAQRTMLGLLAAVGLVLALAVGVASGEANHGLDLGPTTFEGEEVVPAKVEPRDDGSWLLDGRYVLRGKGTEEEPYVVTWDYLASAQQTYNPRRGQWQLPQRVTLLHGKHVRVVGHVTFPFMDDQPRELLLMQNEWDGCCLGMPPTPYDAIEAMLASPANRVQRMATYGALVGKLNVEPFVRGSWLIGLYSMKDAKLDPEV